MRARATWFVVGAVMALGIVALVDALPWPEASEAPLAEEEGTPQADVARPSGRFEAQGVL